MVAGPRSLGLSGGGGGGGGSGSGEDAKADPVATALTTSANIARELVTDQLRSVSKSMILRGSTE